MARKAVKVATLDTTFSLCIRESYDYICQFPNCPECGNHSLREGGLDCSHYKGRRHSAGRWHPANCLALCRPIHSHVDTHKHDHVDLVRNHLGLEAFDDLATRLYGTKKYMPHDRWEMNIHYKAQLEYIKKQRMQGKQGTLPVCAWD